LNNVFYPLVLNIKWYIYFYCFYTCISMSCVIWSSC